MPAAMHITVLVFLFAGALCEGNSSSTGAVITESASLPPTTTKHISTAFTSEKATSFPPSSTSPQTHNGTQATHFSVTPHQTATSNQTPNQTSKQTSNQTSNQTPNQTSNQTPNQTPNQTSNQTPNQTQNQTSNQTPNQTQNQTVSHQSPLPLASDSPNVTATTRANTTSPGLPQEWEKGDLFENPGLVAVLCIFCIIVVLVLVVTTVRCIGSSSNNFERLEDVPMSKVNEQSPFARYSK